MKKLLLGIIIGIFCLVAVSWAWWCGTVSWSTGGHVGSGAEVTAVGVNAHDVTVYTNRYGMYYLGESNGMKPDSTYSKVRAKKWKGDEEYRGYANGGVYQNSPHVDKDITIYPPDQWPEGGDD